MSVVVHTLGCRVNQYESEYVADQLIPLARDVEIHVVNTCTVTSLADRKSRQLVARLRREHPRAIVVAVGCGADGVGDDLMRMGADLLVGNRDKSCIADRVRRLLEGEPPPDAGEWGNLNSERLTGSEARVRALLKVQDGCTVGCTFCRTWQVRGPLRSKTPEVARAEAQVLARCGHREVVVVGINLAQYGADLRHRPSLADLVRTLLTVSEVRLRLSSVSPEGLSDELIALFAREDRLCPHLHLPLQSGDEAVLRRMGRPYTPGRYIERAQAFLDAVPQATVGADVMVGFPGEGEDAFSRTVDVLDQIMPLNVHVFRYSPRRGTRAAQFGDRVSPRESARRAAEIARRARMWAQEVQRRFLGETVAVAVEEEREGRLWGRSGNYLWVEVKGGKGTARGTMVPVRLVEAAPEHLVGVISDSTQDSGNRVR